MIEIRFEEENDANIMYEHLTADTVGAYRQIVVAKERNRITIHVPAADIGYVKDVLIPTLVHFILTVKETKWLVSILEKSFLYVDHEEQMQILHIAQSLLDGRRGDVPKPGLDVEREELLIASLQGFVHNTVSFSFDSYVRFRLKRYMVYLAHLAELAIDEYKLEQEYQTFVEMLRQHVERRKSRLPCLHVVHDGSFLFYDERGIRLNQEKLVQYIDDTVMYRQDIYIDTNVIAPLLSIAPKTIHLYTAHADHSMVITIRNVFQERVIVYPVREFDKVKQR